MNTTMITRRIPVDMACDQTDRICKTMELDERYASVIVDRYIQFHEGATQNVKVLRDGAVLTYEEAMAGSKREIVQYGSNLTHGIQDIYGGVYKEYNAHSGGGTMWGHTWDYWTRGNRSFEVTSEAWANMFDAAFSPKGQAAMKEFLPTAWEWFERRLGGLR